jgi:hypothetical protein
MAGVGGGVVTDNAGGRGLAVTATGRLLSGRPFLLPVTNVTRRPDKYRTNA